MDNSSIARGGNAGIDLGGLTVASINRSALTNNRNAGGVRLESNSAATISDSLLASNAAGVTNVTGGTPTVFLYGNAITRNTVGGLQINSGSMTSLGNNIIRGNAGNEAPTTTITTQ